MVRVTVKFSLNASTNACFRSYGVPIPVPVEGLYAQQLYARTSKHRQFAFTQSMLVFIVLAKSTKSIPEAPITWYVCTMIDFIFLSFTCTCVRHAVSFQTVHRPEHGPLGENKEKLLVLIGEYQSNSMNSCSYSKQTCFCMCSFQHRIDAHLLSVQADSFNRNKCRSDQQVCTSIVTTTQLQFDSYLFPSDIFRIHPSDALTHQSRTPITVSVGCPFPYMWIRHQEELCCDTYRMISSDLVSFNQSKLYPNLSINMYTQIYLRHTGENFGITFSQLKAIYQTQRAPFPAPIL